MDVLKSELDKKKTETNLHEISKTEIKSILKQYAFCFNVYSYFVEEGRMERGGGAYYKLNLQTEDLLERLRYV